MKKYIYGIGMQIDYEAFGKRVKELRVSNGLTQEDIAREVNLSVRHISKIESRGTNTTIEVLVNLANILHTTPDYLLFESITKLRVLLEKEIKDITDDLNYDELKIIIEMMKANKRAIRKSEKIELEKRDRKNNMF